MKNQDLISKIIGDFKKKQFIYGFLVITLIGILSFLLMAMTFLYSTAPLNLKLFKSYFQGKWLMLMNYIPIFFIFIFLSLLFNKLWLGFFITSVPLFIMSIVNRFKIIFRDEPFNFIDLALLTESIDMAQKYPVSLDRYMILIIIIIVLITLMLRRFIPYIIKSQKIRLIYLSALVLLSIIIFRSFYFNPKIYERIGDKELINIWSHSQQFQSKGLVYPFIYSVQDLKDEVPAGYQEEVARAIIENRPYHDIPENQKVNIIAIMLEAYNDFSKYENLDFNIDVYENYHKIQEESYRGTLITNVFAGGTINTEWSFLTGYNSHPRYVRDTNSFVRYFNEQGYKTEAMHPIYGWFYNRRNINEYLGFQNFDYYENKYQYIQEEFLMDRDFFDYIIKGFQGSKEDGKPYFNFSVTYQNHGPYSRERLTEKEYLKREAHYHEETYNIINNYLDGLYKTDQALKKLVDYFKEQEPTLIILFGDHNPWLGEDALGYEMLDINLDTSTLEGFLNYYETPYIIWANPRAKELLKRDFNEEGPNISPNFLMAELFGYLGWKGNEYMNYLAYVKENFDVNHKIYFKEDGKFTRHLSEERLEIWKEFTYVQYYFSRNPIRINLNHK